MRPHKIVFVLSLLLSLSAIADPRRSGFSLPDSLNEFTIAYREIDNLIVLPFQINADKTVHLILDTGCRNVVLFGRSHRKGLEFLDHKVKVSGMGAGSAAAGELSLGNTVEIGSIAGCNMPIIVVPSNQLLVEHPGVDGLIGYEIFSRFELEINPKARTITFRSHLINNVPSGFDRINFRMEDAKPSITSSFLINGHFHQKRLIIDTGSALSLLVKTSQLTVRSESQVVGKGVNGLIRGSETYAETIQLDNTVMHNVPTAIISSAEHDYASLGMGALKEYIFIINYTQEYIGLKKIG